MSDELVSALNYWLNEQYNTPSRDDWYIIQLTHTVASMMTDKNIDINTWKLLFDKKDGKVLKTDDERRSAQAQYEKNVAALAKFHMNIPGAQVKRGNIFKDQADGNGTRNIAYARTPEGRLLRF